MPCDDPVTISTKALPSCQSGWEVISWITEAKSDVRDSTDRQSQILGEHFTEVTVFGRVVMFFSTFLNDMALPVSSP